MWFIVIFRATFDVFRIEILVRFQNLGPKNAFISPNTLSILEIQMKNNYRQDNNRV